MKNRVIKRFKKMLAVTMAISMFAGLGMVANARTYDETEVDNDKIYYEKRTDYEDYLGGEKDNQIPKPVTTSDNAGLLFGGWFMEVEGKYRPMSNADGVIGDVYAKWVPARLLSVKFQNQLGTTETQGPNGSSSTDVKVITTVDSLNYAKIWFTMKVISLSDENKTYNGAIDVVGDSTDFEVKTVYHQLQIEGEPIDPETVFGAEAEYFATSWIRSIPSTAFGAILYVQPHWETLDGATVDGLAKYGHVSDAFGSTTGKRKISVPINIRDFAGVAAGVLQITPPEGADCVGIECGRVFGEMDFAKKTGGSVKLVGNLKEMTKDNKTNDIYANIIFEVAGTSTDLITGKDFVISDVDFADVAETPYTDKNFPVWNISY